MNPKYDCYGRPQGYKKPSGLRLRAHAVRGAITRKTLLAEGVECPAIFGILAGFCHKSYRQPQKPMNWELSRQIFMLEKQSPASRVLETFKCFDVGSEKKVKIITTLHAPSWEGFVERSVKSLHADASSATSFHGLIVPQAYGIPAMFLHHNSSDRLIKGDLCDDDLEIDIRVRDFHVGGGRTSLPSRPTSRGQDGLGRRDQGDRRCRGNRWRLTSDRLWSAFPLTLGPREDRWKISGELAAQIVF